MRWVKFPLKEISTGFKYLCDERKRWKDCKAWIKHRYVI